MPNKITIPGEISAKPSAAPKIAPAEVRFFSGRSHPFLAQRMADWLGLPLEPVTFQRFGNDNLSIQLGASVRGREVYIVQSLTPPVNEHLMELFIMLDIAHSAGAREVHAVIPYFSYARSDKKDAPRISIAARLIADLLQTSGATHVMMMTLHAPQVHGFFRVPTDPLTARYLFMGEIKDWLSRLTAAERAATVVVAPDYGQAGSASRLASDLGLNPLVADKKRISDTRVEISAEISDQVRARQFKQAIIYDDEVASGSSVVELSEKLVDGGIEKIMIYCTHGLFVGDALGRIFAVPQVQQIVTTNTCPQTHNDERVKVLDVGPVFAEAIEKNYKHESIGDLFSYNRGKDD